MRGVKLITATELCSKIGRLAVVAGPVGGRTVLRSLHSEGTLKAMRVHYLDPALPAMAFLTIASPGGGVLQGDRLEIDISIEAGGQLHAGTTSSTRIYAMPRGQAEASTSFSVARGAYAEFVPDPFIPYAGSRFAGRAQHVVAEGGALLLAEVVGPGRQARGESLAYDFFQSETEVRRPDGTLLFRETTRLCPADDLTSPGLLAGWRAIGTLYAISDGLDASVFDPTLARCEGLGLLAGCSELPNEAGCWFRVLAPDAPAAHDAVKDAWAAARVQTLGFGPPAPRRY
jgi:urease accessory protein